MVRTDKSLIDAHLKGDREAFREIILRYGDSLLTYLVRMTGSRDQAEDIFQETFKRVHEKGHMLRSDRIKNWLFTTATRLAIDASRHRKRRRVIPLVNSNDCEDGHCDALDTLPADQAADPSESLVREEQKRQVREAVESLPPRQRATLVLSYFQQLSHVEVAQVLGCSVGTVKTQMSRALRTLAGRLPESVGVTK